MTVTDIASRTYNHGWRLDPIVRSLLDTDFYKLLMLQMIRQFYPHEHVTFSVINRTHHVRLGEVIDEGELRAQLDHARTVRFTKKELIWLAGNSFYGSKQIFSPEFLRWLEEFRLPEYSLEKRDGQFVLEFPGRWVETTMWEIPALAIINELRSRAALRQGLDNPEARHAGLVRLIPGHGEPIDVWARAGGPAPPLVVGDRCRRYRLHLRRWFERGR